MKLVAEIEQNSPHFPHHLNKQNDLLESSKTRYEVAAYYDRREALA